MRKAWAFGSYEQFRNEVLRHGSGPFQSPVDDLAEEMYHTEINEEFDSLWDKVDDDE